MGLGKMGGRALGYASDVELMFVYSDQGRTTGPRRVGNAEYYEQLVRATTARISARRAGIFEVDLRLRPYGAAGPRAVSLESFTRYYGPGGAALAYERLAAAAAARRGRRPRAGRAAGAAARPIRVRGRRGRPGTGAPDAPPAGGRVRRRHQAQTPSSAPARWWTWSTRSRCCRCAMARPPWELRSSSVHQALDGLAQAGLLAAEEAEQIQGRYGFFRLLINALRMLRGSARDLYLPPAHAPEYGHLARRMGYREADGLAPAQQLRLELETRRAAVRRFIDTRLGRGSLGSDTITGLADLVLSLPPADTARAAADAAPATVLRRLGFAQPERAAGNVIRLARRAPDRTEFARLAVLAGDTLALQPDPDRALNNWERFAAALDDPGRHFRTLLRQPTRLELLLRIFATSQFLADALVRGPELFDWVTEEPERLHGRRRLQDVALELEAAAGGAPDRTAWLRRLRALRRREILRIAIRDFCLEAPVTDVMADLSTVAEAFVDAALTALTRQPEQPALGERTCILALGKLGAEELNYSSDIDLVALYDDRGLGAAAGAELSQAVSALARGFA